jgi:hypothetical protein
VLGCVFKCLGVYVFKGRERWSDSR